MTAFYMFRLMGLTFWGSWRGPQEIWDRIHESPRVMVVPLVILAFFSATIGLFLGLPFGDSRINGWLAPVFEESEIILGRAAPTFELFGIDGVLILISVTVATIGVIVAWRLFGVRWLVFHREPQPERVAAITARTA